MKFNKNNDRSTQTASKGGDLTAVDLNDNKYAQHEPVQAKPLEVIVYNNNFDRALKAFRALVQRERVLSSYKERQTYEKPSQKKRRKKNEMKRKLMELEGYKKDKE